MNVAMLSDKGGMTFVTYRSVMSIVFAFMTELQGAICLLMFLCAAEASCAHVDWLHVSASVHPMFSRKTLFFLCSCETLTSAQYMDVCFSSQVHCLSILYLV